MNPYDTHRPRSKSAVIIFLLVLVAGGLAAGAWFFGARFESQPPQITLKPDSDVVGTGPVEITISDPGAGLKSIEVKLGEATIASEQFGTNIRATVTTTVPNFVRGALIPITFLFEFFVKQFDIITAAYILTFLLSGIAFFSLSQLKESFGKDLDYVEDGLS